MFGKSDTFYILTTTKHTSKKSQDQLFENSVKVLEYVSQSQENLWRGLKVNTFHHTRYAKRILQRIGEIRRKLFQACGSFQGRLEFAIAAKGESTKYEVKGLTAYVNRLFQSFEYNLTKHSSCF